MQLAMITPVMVWVGWPIHRTGWLALAHRAADMNSLITLGTLAALGYSLVATVAPSVLPVRRPGRVLRGGRRDHHADHAGPAARGRAKAGTGEAIRRLIGLQARVAHVVRDGVEVDVPVEDVQPGDVIGVRPARRCPSTARSSRAARGGRVDGHRRADAGHQGRRVTR